MIPMLAQLPPYAINLMVIGFFIVCLIMVLAVLIQKPQGGGLSGAFGSGAGSGQTAFGARTGDALTVATIGVFVFYILAAIGLNYAVRPTVAAPPGVQATGAPAPADSTGTTGTTPAPIQLTPVQVPPSPDPTPEAPETDAPAGDQPEDAPEAAPEVPPAAEPATEPATEPFTPPSLSTPPATPG